MAVQDKVHFLAEKQVCDVGAGDAVIGAGRDARRVHGHHYPGNRRGPGTVDCCGGPVIASAAEGVVGGSVRKRNSRRDKHKTCQGILLRDINVVLPAVGPHSPGKLVRQASGKIVDVSVLSIAFVVARYQLEREARAGAGRDEITPGLLSSGGTIRKVAQRQVQVRFELSDS